MFAPPASTLPPDNERAAILKTTDTPRVFPHFSTRQAWEAHKAFILDRILVSCGLSPLPANRPAPPSRIFDRLERADYTIEKVWIQTYPGFYLAGNLYRPKTAPRCPAVLVAHGHWENGRLADGPDGSIAARAITFARQGYVAFTYDMIGYNDTRQIPHTFANDRQHRLWGISLMGLQTWNSLRALDFLAALPEVDTARLAMTGESGGGTQTMMLGAIDDRLAAVGPCVMVSHTMQGGCLCENAPGLRLDVSNVEIAAASAPKIQSIVGASGDWTKTTMTMEGPAVKTIYELEGVPDRLNFVQYDFGHNINRTSREAVYAWFGKHLLGENDEAKLKEPPYQKEPDAALRVFPDDKPLPPDAKNADELTNWLKAQSEAQLQAAKPTNARSLAAFRKTYLPLWQHTLAVEPPPAHELLAEVDQQRSMNDQLTMVRAGRSDRIPALLFKPFRRGSVAVVIAHPDGIAAFMGTGNGTRIEFFSRLIGRGRQVLLLDSFQTGQKAESNVQSACDYDANHFTTYNRTDLQNRVQDLIRAVAYLRAQPGISRVLLVGEGRAGIAALLAAPAADAVAADCDGLDLTTDGALLANDLYVPGLRRMGDFRTAATLAAPHPLLLHNTGERFTAQSWISDVYRASSKPERFQMRPERCDEKALYDWLISASRSVSRCDPILRLPPTGATTKE